MANIQAFLDSLVSGIQSNPNYQKIKAMPPTQRWATIGGLFIVSQVLVFGLLYLLFGKIVVIGFFASIVAELTTGVGALSALFFKEISDKLFSSLLGGAVGVMLTATAFHY